MSDSGRYSLWLTPPKAQYRKLADLIRRLAKSHSAPVFDPHITLLGAIEAEDEEQALRLTHLLATRIEPFEIRLSHVRHTSEYYRCLYLKAEPTDGLIRANIEAKLVMAELIGAQEFYPHMSLLYGNYFSMIKEAIIADMGSTMEVSFEVNSVRLVRTDGGPELWKAIGEFNFI